MTGPAIFFSILLATMLGSAFHLVKGGSGGRFIFLLVLAWVGFALGHLAGSSWGIEFLMIGPVHGGLGVLGSIALLVVGNWFTQLDKS